jgi:hypothetical protein
MITEYFFFYEPLTFITNPLQVGKFVKRHVKDPNSGDIVLKEL